jgi:hypothetical protein
MSSQCGIANKYDRNAGTCFTKEQVSALVDAHNRMVTLSRVKITGKRYENSNPIPIGSKLEMLNELRKRLKKVCPDGDDVCILNQEIMNEIATHIRDDLHSAILPLGPRGRTEWLANDEIDAVMFPYMKVYPDFCYLGTNASNCHKYSGCQFDYEGHLSAGRKYFGAIFNLDKIGQGGSHWVAMLIDIPARKIYYCDSNGIPPNTSIQDFIDETKQKLERFKLKQINNKKAFQTDGSECGVYSCNFIIRMLSQKETFQEIIDNPLNFTEINSCRKAYFRNDPGIPGKPVETCRISRD